MPAIKRILVPVDFSPPADSAIDYAQLLAHALGASITLAHVCEIPSQMVGIVPNASVQGDLAEERAAAKALLERRVAAIAERDRPDIETLVLIGSPAQTIVERAKDDGFDLIVMGTHGRTGVSHLLMGSVAERVVRAATCPVMTVHLAPS